MFSACSPTTGIFESSKLTVSTQNNRFEALKTSYCTHLEIKHTSDTWRGYLRVRRVKRDIVRIRIIEIDRVMHKWLNRFHIKCHTVHIWKLPILSTFCRPVSTHCACLASIGVRIRAELTTQRQNNHLMTLLGGFHQIRSANLTFCFPSIV